jgi:hypothetical protein
MDILVPVVDEAVKSPSPRREEIKVRSPLPSREGIKGRGRIASKMRILITPTLTLPRQGTVL